MNLPFDCQLMCYKVGSHAVASVPLVLQCVFRKSEVGERFEPKTGGGEWRSPASYGTLTTDVNLRSCSTSGPVSTGMGDRSRVYHFGI